MRVADFDRDTGMVRAAEPTVRSITRNQVRRLKLREGDLLLEKSGGGEAQPVGFVAQYDGSFGPGGQHAVCSNFIAKVRPSASADPGFMRHLFGCVYDLRLNVPYIKQTTGIQNLDVHAFLNQRWVVPNDAKQRAIASSLDGRFERISKTIGELDCQIELLAEHRRALITAAVTGQLKVPGVAV